MRAARKAQTSMILLVVILIIFAALAIFLMSLAETVSPKEYMNMYTSNLLLSILRADTGSHDPECRYVSDLISCSFFMPSSYQCPGLGMSCRELADSRIDYYMSKYAGMQQSFRYLLTVKPRGFVAKEDGGEGLALEFGDPSLKEEKVQKWAANELIQRVSRMTEYYLTVNLLISVD
jgi:hypothetical protein